MKFNITNITALIVAIGSAFGAYQANVSAGNAGSKSADDEIRGASTWLLNETLDLRKDVARIKGHIGIAGDNPQYVQVDPDPVDDELDDDQIDKIFIDEVIIMQVYEEPVPVEDIEIEYAPEVDHVHRKFKWKER